MLSRRNQNQVGPRQANAKFTVTHPSGQFAKFKANSKQEADEWIKHLSAATQRVSVAACRAKRTISPLRTGTGGGGAGPGRAGGARCDKNAGGRLCSRSAGNWACTSHDGHHGPPATMALQWRRRHSQKWARLGRSCRARPPRRLSRRRAGGAFRAVRAVSAVCTV